VGSVRDKKNCAKTKEKKKQRKYLPGLGYCWTWYWASPKSVFLGL
jgi:hypothetical protein